MEDLEIIKFVVGELSTNCYLLKSGEEGVIIDPGAEGERIFKRVEDLELRLKYVLNTHGHFDHIAANDFIRERTTAKVAIHRLDAESLGSSLKNSSLLLGWDLKQSSADIFLEEGDILSFGFHSLTVLHTPGHTPGSVSFSINDRIFTGDLIFAGSIGRTDLPGGSSKAMVESLKRLRELPEETIIYPGHGPETSVRREIESNPFLSEDWVYEK